MLTINALVSTGTGLFKFTGPGDPARAFQAVLVTFFFPALFEELVFRGPLIFLQRRKISRILMIFFAFLSLLAFVLWHPMNTLIFMPEAKDLFTDWRFLTNAFLLGLAATLVTLRTGSLWPAVAIHWTAVTAWIVFMGGPEFG